MKGRRIVFPECGRAAMEDFDVPPLKPGCVLIETECSVISPGTELACPLCQPDTPNTFPQHPGGGVKSFL